MPRSTLTREQIVRTAIDLLDEEGLDGLNMRSLGARLGAAATAVYWHVQSKENLVLLAGDEVWREIDLPDPGDADWRDAVEAAARGLHAMCRRHPWLVQAFGTHLFHGPGKARYDDHCLGLYEDAGFTPDQADRAAGAVLTLVLGDVLAAAAEVSLTRRLDRDGDAAARFAATVAEAREVAARFPRLRHRLDTPAATRYAAGPDQSFEFGLRALVHGLAAELASTP